VGSDPRARATLIGHLWQNRDVPRVQRSVAVLVLLVAFGLACVAPCSGWSASAHARMACCAHGHGEPSQAAADACCAAGEQQDHAYGVNGALVAVPPPQLVASDLFQAAFVPSLGGAVVAHRVPHGPPRHTLILLSVFLI
jgi:hypothetical protein